MMARSAINKLLALLWQICVCTPASAPNPEELDWVKIGRAAEPQDGINR